MYMRIIAILAALAFSSCNDSRSSSRFELPSGYRGWVFIFWQTNSAPPLPESAGERIFRIPADGVLYTSSEGEYDGWANDSYYWTHRDGRLERFGSTGSPHIHSQGGGTYARGDEVIARYSRFYVGDEAPPPGSESEALEAILKKPK
jgi:hypothetical protein